MILDTWVQSLGESYRRFKKKALDAALLTTQHYKVRIKGKVDQYRELSSALAGVVAIEKGALWSPSTKVAELYVHKENLASNNMQCLIYYKTKPTKVQPWYGNRSRTMKTLNWTHVCYT